MREGRKRVLGVLAGNDLPIERLAQWASEAELLIAADGGADRLVAAGFTPHYTLGDLDSLRATGLPNVARFADQDTSDCDKLLDFAAALGVEHLTLTCVEGDRLDHVLATFASALRSSLEVSFALRRGPAHLVREAASFPATPGDRVSLMPIVPCQGVTLSGVRWPLTDSELTPLGQVSLSNEVTESQVEVSLAEGGAVIFFIPR